MPSRRRWLARLAGVILAADLIVWDHAIGAISAPGSAPWWATWRC